MIKYYRPLLIGLSLLSSAAAIAQNSVTGKIVDKASNPVPYANVILLNAQDSVSVYKGAVSEESGVFRFSEIEKNDYLLKISFVGFEDYLRKINVSKDEDLGEFMLSENVSNLGEVDIRVKNPTVKREVDRLVFNVANTSLSSGNSWDILRKTPGVIATNGTLQVRNQGVQVYINDRKVYLTASELRDLLESYAAENIESVEVIMNPPARYDAEGGAILNIVTSKGISIGYKGSVDAAWTQAIFPKYNLGTSHYYKTDKLNLFANYSFSPRKEFKEDESFINFMDEDEEVFSRWETDFERTTRSNAHNANIILDYELDEKNTLNFSSNVLYSPNKTFKNEVFTDIPTQLNMPYSDLLTNSSLGEDQVNFAADLEFRHKMDKEGAEISARGHFTRYEQDRQQDVATNYYTGGGDLFSTYAFSTAAQQEINIYVGQIDYVTPLGSTNFEAGVKTSIINSLSGIDYFDVMGSEETYNSQLSDQFSYDEKIFAGYLSFAKDWDVWSMKGGLRGEFTDRTGFSEAMQQEDNRDYFELFPTFYLQHRISNNHSLTFDYSRRIQRPRYESLNPFRYFLTEYNFNAGNPDLGAAISNNFNLNYSLKNAYFFDLYYRDNGPSVSVLSFQDNENTVLRNVNVNLLESFSYGLDITHGRSLTDFWYTYAYVSLFHEEQTFLALESNNAEVSNEIDGFFGMWSNSFTLSKDGTFSGDLTLTYISDWLTGSYYLDPMTTLSFGVRKTLWNNRAEVTLHVEDALNETNTWMRADYLNQDNGFFARPESRYVRVGFKYNFGNFRLSDNERSIEAAERDRL
ncbi:outer membrane beta-barrel protein [Salinimicrobium sp. GXAS 041]|uniref:outer membrane beta-barrel protein n=1 Tax=Salinimicrobium sp. GXAS 041 TaxID=3400806 RepID=UPI003C75630D